MGNKKYVSKLLGERAAFTLVETVIALSVCVLAIFLMTSFVHDRQREYSSARATDHYQFVSAISVLQSDKLSLEYENNKDNQIFLYSPAKKMDYSLKIIGKRLVMQGKDEGYMPLLFNIDKGDLSFKPPYVKLNLVIHGIRYKENLAFVQSEKRDGNE